jgi:ABC-type maltose transport system permease subunit
MDVSALASMATVTAIENNLPIYILSGHVADSAGIFSKNPNINSMVAALPLMVLYLALMRYFIEGLTAGAIKM